jgi:polysaccharide export outer membrane protein
MQRRLWLLSAVGLLAIGCRTITPEEFEALHKIQVALLEAHKSYIVQPGDTVKVTVYRGAALAPEYSQEITVQPDGLIHLVNLAQPVDTKGMTVTEVQERLKQLYSPIFQAAGAPVGAFEVTVQFLTSQKSAWLPDQVFVTGQVRSPKAVAYKPGMTTMKAIAEAGGWIYAGNECKVVILRMGPEGKSVAREIDLAAVALYETQDVELMPGDVVFVPLTIIARINLIIEYYIRGLIPINPSIIRSFFVI